MPSSIFHQWRGTNISNLLASVQSRSFEIEIYKRADGAFLKRQALGPENFRSQNIYQHPPPYWNLWCAMNFLSHFHSFK